ncbi:MAG: DinB family protein [Candidatus Heimdallarchaeota archaeon]|nr:DinB family protein [Candidatus Heimdallarchaeota archaeon]
MDSNGKQETCISNGLLSQFASTWKMLKQAINIIPDEYWYMTNKEWTYSYTVYHIIETQEFYLRNDPEGMQWGRLLGGEIDNENIPAEEKYPSKAVIIDYMEKIETKIIEHLQNISNEQLFQKDGFKWFSSVFEKLLYLLRHNAHHLGELGRMLREWDCERMRWQ